MCNNKWTRHCITICTLRYLHVCIDVTYCAYLYHIQHHVFFCRYPNGSFFECSVSFHLSAKFVENVFPSLVVSLASLGLVV